MIAESSNLCYDRCSIDLGEGSGIFDEHEFVAFLAVVIVITLPQKLHSDGGVDMSAQ